VGYSHQGTAFLSALGVSFISNDTQNIGTMTGQPGTITDGYIFPYNIGTDPNYSVDEISSSMKSVIFKSNNSYLRTIAYENAQYRTITSSPVLGGLIDDGDNTKTNLMATYLGYLLKIDGRVRGVVTNANTGEPIIGANVTVGTDFDYTNDYGMYAIELQPGTYSLTCTSPGYVAYTHPSNIEVNYCETTWINIEMVPLVSNDDDILSLRNEITSVNPNPVMTNAEIYFTLTESKAVDISLYNIKGQKLSTLLSDTRQAGTHIIKWDKATDLLTPGVYFLRMNVDDKNMVRKVLVIE